MLPEGVTCIDIPKKFLYQNVTVIPDAFGGGQPYPPDSNEAKEIAADTIFVLKSMSGLPAQSPNFPGILYFQLMYPSGRVMQNVLADLSPDLGFGSGRTVFDAPIFCPAGSKFFITLDTSISGNSSGGGVTLTTAILLEGALRYFLKSNSLTPPRRRTAADSAALVERFFYDSPNQNPMAPEWMVSGRDGVQCTPEVPTGFQDQPFTYSNTASALQTAVFSEAAPAATTIEIPTEATTDFLCRRIMFSVQASDIAPTFFIRLRTSLGGSSITNDYIPMQGMRFHKDWRIRAGIQVYIDVFGITNGGTGTTTVYAYLEGVKRGRA